MESRIMQVFYGNDCLPYKDSARTVHYPIVGSSFLGANNTTQIRFYVRDIGGVSGVSWVAISKLPNGKIGNQVLSNPQYDSELDESYIALVLSSYYTQVKGDVFISLNGYQGGVQIVEDEETGIYTITGTPIIEATGSIKLAINYAPQLPLGEHFNTSDLQQVLGALSEKPNYEDLISVIRTDNVHYNDTIEELWELLGSEFFIWQGSNYQLVQLNKNTSNNQKFNISKEVEMSVSVFESMMYEKNITLETHINDGIEFNGDKEDIKHIISILLDNSIFLSFELSKILTSKKEE